jgi:hypothetical protein
MASAAYEIARTNPSSFMAGGVALTFPAFDDLPEKKLWLGTRDFESDGDEYKAALADMPYFRSQKGLGQDAVDFTVNDAKSAWYEIIKPYQDVFSDTECIAGEFLKTSSGVFESETVMSAFLEQMSLSEGSLSIPFSAISDMSRTGFLVGGRILTQRYCAARFNKNGLKNPLFDACGWQTAQGGNPVFCTHKVKGADGCEDHLNDWRYFAVEALSSAEITSTGSNGGWEYGGDNPCFTPKTLVWMADGSCKPIWQVKKGDYVMSFTPAGVLVKRKVTQAFTHTVDHHLVFDFGRDRLLEPTEEHLMLFAPDLFKPAVGFGAGDTLRSRNDSGWFDFIIRNNWLNERRTRVHNFEVWGTHTYFVVVGGVKIGVHNRCQEPILV